MKHTIEVTRGFTRWFKKGTTILHRVDGPAIEYANGDKKWYLDGKRHRVDGPAIEYANGTKEWYLYDKLHRIDGPAIEYTNGNKEWYIDGKLHRVDGPAIEYVDGTKFWYLDGKEYSEAEYYKEIMKRRIARHIIEVKITHKEARKFALELLDSLFDAEEQEFILETAYGKVMVLVT